MVNRINNNDYYDYSKLKMPDPSDKADNGEKFSLNYQRAQEEKEDKDKKDKTEETEESVKISPRSVTQGGVRLELSRNGQTASKTEQAATGQTSASGQGLMDTVLAWVRGFAQAVKAFLYKVWNDEAQPDVMQDDASAEDASTMPGPDAGSDENTAQIAAEPERLTEEYLAQKELESLQNPELAAFRQMQREAAKNKEIQKYLRSGNLEQVLSIVTDNGRKTMARNSSLLTYYDRTGKITSLSASDQERILHGDRNVKKL